MRRPLGKGTKGTGFFVRTRLAIKFHALLERYFPERRVFLRSDTDTRFIRLRPGSQLLAFAGASAIVAWAIIATAILVMDSIGAGNFREQAKRDQRTYEMRLNALSSERDKRAEEAVAAQERFNSALKQISVMQSELLASETRRRELETGIAVIQSTLRTAMTERDTARDEAEHLTVALQDNNGAAQPGSGNSAADGTLNVLAAALQDTARERDQIREDAQTALLEADEMASRLKLIQDQNDQIFSQLEEAMTISVEPLDKMFRAAGMNTDDLLKTVRRGYSGQGGPLMPLSFSTRGEAERHQRAALAGIAPAHGFQKIVCIHASGAEHLVQRFDRYCHRLFQLAEDLIILILDQLQARGHFIGFQQGGLCIFTDLVAFAGGVLQGGGQNIERSIRGAVAATGLRGAVVVL